MENLGSFGRWIGRWSLPSECSKTSPLAGTPQGHSLGSRGWRPGGGGGTSAQVLMRLTFTAGACVPSHSERIAIPAQLRRLPPLGEEGGGSG